MSEEQSINKTEARRLRKRAVAVAEEHTRTALDFCEVLYQTFYACVKNEGEILPVWQLWEFESWEDYCESELKIHKGRATSLKRVWSRLMVDLAGKWDDNLALSITHLRILTYSVLVTPKTVDSWTRKATNMTCCELEHALGGNVGDLTSFGTALTASEVSELKDILRLAASDGVIIGLRKRGEALMKIVRQWASAQKKKKGRAA